MISWSVMALSPTAKEHIDVFGYLRRRPYPIRLRDTRVSFGGGHVVPCFGGSWHVGGVWLDSKIEDPEKLLPLRHTYISRLVLAGVDIRTVQELAGHKTITMTMRY